MGNKKNCSRKRKYHFHGNQHDTSAISTPITSTPVAEQSNANDCLRVRKVNLSAANTSNNNLNQSDYNLLINFDVLQRICVTSCLLSRLFLQKH